MQVYHCDVGEVPPVPGANVYFDPPYEDCPRYAKILPRARVLETALRWAEVARQVVVSEAVPLPLPGWATQRLRHHGKPEWLTSSKPLGVVRPRQPEQIALEIPDPGTAPSGRAGAL